MIQRFLRGQVINERFSIEEWVGEGGFASVYRAHDRQTGETVAIKCLEDFDTVASERFLHEARILATLDHPHIVRHVANGRTSSNDLYLVMEWLSGETLESRLRRAPLTTRETVTMAQRLASALEAAHVRGRVHRDIKPSNIILVDLDVRQVKVIDFGVARMTDRHLNLTQTGAILGTPGYMAPEQARGEGNESAAADVFSLGCVMFECLAGQPPFEGTHTLAILAKILFVDPPRLEQIRPEIPNALSKLVDRMLSKDPGERPQSGGRVGEELDHIAAMLSEMGGDALPNPIQHRPAITAVERRLVSILAIVPMRGGSDGELDTDTRIDIAGMVGAITKETNTRTEILVDGTVVTMLVGDEHVLDRAAQAARYALRIRAALTDARIVLVTALSENRPRTAIGEVMDRAAGLLAQARELPHTFICIDEATRAMLGARFEVLSQHGLDYLHAERTDDGAGRQLLGKPSPFVGRDREMRQACSIVEAGFSECAPATLLIIGEAGAGKSRFRHELVTRLKPRINDLVITLGRGESLGGSGAFGLLRSALREFFKIEVGQPHLEQLHAFDAAVHALFDEQPPRDTKEFLGELVGVAFPDDGTNRLALARRDARVMEAAIVSAWIEFIRKIASKQPFLLLLEDLHWGDTLSLKAIGTMMQEVQDVPLVVAVFARPEAREGLLLQWSAFSMFELRLGGLPRRAAESLVHMVLGAAVPSNVVDEVVTKADGNAFYLEELIRAVSEGRGKDLPPTVLGMVEARLSSLDADLRRVLRASSIFGEFFWPLGVQRLLGDLEAAEARQLFHALEARELISRRRERRFVGEEEFAFRHALVREGAYAMLTEKDRKNGHLRAAQWLVERSATLGKDQYSDKPEDLAILAHHFGHGEAWEDAATYHERTAVASARLNAASEARRHYDATLGALEKLADTADLQRHRIDVTIARVNIGYATDPAENLALLDRAEGLAQGLPEITDATSDDCRRLCRVHYWMGRCHYYAGAYPTALGYYRRVLEAGQALGDDELIAHPSGALGRVMMGRGNFLVGRALIERALGPLERTGQLSDWIVSAMFMAVGFGGEGRVNEALEWIERGNECAKKVGHHRDISIARTMAGVTLQFLGRPNEVVASCTIAAEAAQAGNEPLYDYLAHGVGAWGHTRLDDHDTAEAWMQKAESIQRALGRRLLFADWFEAIRVEMAARAGRYEEAITLGKEYIPAMRAAGTIFAEGLVHRSLGRTLAALGPERIQEAQAEIEECIRVFTQGGILAEVARAQSELAEVRGR